MAELLRVKCDYCGGTFPDRFAHPGVISHGNRQDCQWCGHQIMLPSGAYEQLRDSQPPESAPRNLKYEECLSSYDGIPVMQLLSQTIRSVEMQSTIGSFLSAVKRLSALSIMPLQLTGLARLVELFTTQSLYEVTGSFDREPLAHDRQDIRERGAALWKEWLEKNRNDPGKAIIDVGLHGIQRLSPMGVGTEWHCRLSGLKLRRVASEQFGAGLVAGLHQ